jgi:hypothetical protein
MDANLAANPFIDKLKPYSPQHLAVTYNRWHKLKYGWQTHLDLASVITCKVWSPIIFTHNQRIMDYYAVAYWCVLDFDAGDFRLVDAYDEFGDYHHIIGTTRSHQKWKDQAPPCDRFRVCIPWETPITCAFQYKKNLQRVVKKYGADIKSTDAAHPFFPCKELLSTSRDGKRMPVKQYKHDPPPKFEIRNLRRSDGSIFEPTWVKGLLQLGTKDGRNNAIFRVTKELLRYGAELDEISARIEGSALWQHDEPEASRRTIESAYNNLLKEMSNGQG